MIIDRILLDANLFAIRRLDVSENGIRVTFDPALMDENGYLHDDKVCILKLDDYIAYNSKHTHNPPRVIDNLIIVQCCDGSIDIYLIELRKSEGTRPTRRLQPSEIEEKFRTAIYDFLAIKQKDIFSEYQIRQIKAFLVTDPWNHSNKVNGKELFAKKLQLSCLDAYSSRKPFEVFGHTVIINPILPPDPTIKPC
jgi:hypothetical protein